MLPFNDLAYNYNLLINYYLSVYYVFKFTNCYTTTFYDYNVCEYKSNLEFNLYIYNFKLLI